MIKPPLPQRVFVGTAIQDAIAAHQVDLVEAAKLANQITPAMAQALLSARAEYGLCLTHGTYPTLAALERRGLVHRHRYAAPGHSPRTYRLTPLGRAVARRRAKIGIKPAPLKKTRHRKSSR